MKYIKVVGISLFISLVIIGIHQWYLDLLRQGVI
jgi:hypothetical protein